MPKNANEKPAQDRHMTGTGPPWTRTAQAGPSRPKWKIFSAFQASLGQSTPSHFFVVVVDLTSPKLVRAAIN